MKLQIEWKGVILDIVGRYYPGCKERGEHGYSLGTPAEPASFSIDRITIGGQEIYPGADLLDNDIEEIEIECLQAQADFLRM